MEPIVEVTAEAGEGWVFWSPDSGEEYAPQHPVESGEVPDAERIRRSTAQEDVLWQAFQNEAERAHRLSTPSPDLKADNAALVVTTEMIDAGAKFLRETNGAGKRLTPWGDTPKSTKKKWLTLSAGTLHAALQATEPRS